MDKIEKVKKILEEFGEEVRQTVETPNITFVMVVARLTTARNKAAKEISQLFEAKGDKPTFLRAAIADWKNGLISFQRLCEIWQVPYYHAYYIFCRQGRRITWFDVPVEEIKEILEQCYED